MNVASGLAGIIYGLLKFAHVDFLHAKIPQAGGQAKANIEVDHIHNKVLFSFLQGQLNQGGEGHFFP